MLPASTPRDIAAVLACVNLAAPAAAQQAQPDTPPARVEVTGSMAAYDARRDDTAMKIVVGREDMARYGDTNVLEVLKRVPGVTVTAANGRTEVRMRGLGEGYTQILVNGERTPAGFALDTLAPALIERIEVLRAATAEYSTQSVAGTINIVLRRSVRKTQREARLGYLLSGDFKGPTASLELADRGEKFSYSLSANANHESFSRVSGNEDDTRLPDGEVTLRRATAIPEQGRINRFGLSPRLNWTLDGGDTLSWETLVNGSRFRNRSRALATTALGEPAPLPDLRSAMEDDNTSLRSSLAWSHGFDSGAKLDLKLGVEGLRRTNLQQRSGDDTAGRLATDGSVRVELRERGVNSTGKYTRLLAGGHTLALGWEGRLNRRDDERSEHDAVRSLAPGLLPDAGFTARVSRLAAYAQDEWTIGAAWSAYLGVRWEGVRTRASGTGFAGTRLRSSVLSPLAQVLWKIPGSKGDQLRLALSRTYKAPELESLVPRRQTWENNSPTEADYQGNPDLRPELAWGLDAAWEHYWMEGAMVSVAASMRRIEDSIGNRVVFDGARWILTPANVGRADSRSLELETKFPLTALMEGAPALDLRASLSRNWSRVAAVPGPDNRIEQQTPLTATLGADYKTGAWTAGASAAFRSPTPARLDVNRWTYVRARTDLEAYTVWKFNPKAQLRIALANLLGADEGFSVSYADPVAGLQTRRWTYPGGVKLRTTLEATF